MDIILQLEHVHNYPLDKNPVFDKIKIGCIHG